MLPDRVSNPGPLTYESGALPIALRGPATMDVKQQYNNTTNVLEMSMLSHVKLNNVIPDFDIVCLVGKRLRMFLTSQERHNPDCLIAMVTELCHPIKYISLGYEPPQLLLILDISKSMFISNY